MSTTTDLPNLELLIKLLKMTTSSSDGEATVAIRKANEQLAKVGGDWETLLRGKVKIIGDPFGNVAMPQGRDQRYTPKPPPRPAPPAPPKPAPRPSSPPPRSTYTPQDDEALRRRAEAVLRAQQQRAAAAAPPLDIKKARRTGAIKLGDLA